MPKKEETNTSKKIITISKPKKVDNVNKVLIENFVELQKIMTEFSSKFDKLSNQLSELLNLFEESAKTLVKKEFEIVKEAPAPAPNSELSSKIDKIIDQNKIIARGLTLIHEKSNTPQQLTPQIQPTPYSPPQQYKEEIRKPLNKPEPQIKKSFSIEKDEEESPPVFEIP